MRLTIKTIWRTQNDEQVCPLCKMLEGYTWTTDATELYPKQLVHPIYGPVYDTRPAADCSLIKEKKGHVCRCTIERQLDVSNTQLNSESNNSNIAKMQP